MTRRVIVERIAPPIPIRNYDYRAYFEGADPERQLEGWGDTADAATQDLRDAAEANE